MMSRCGRGASVLLLFGGLAMGQEGRDPRPSEAGFPLMRLFDDTDHGGAPQNFDVAADARGYIYVGNLQGLLIWDGARFRLAPSETALYRVATNTAGRVVTGGPQSLMTLEAASDGSPVLRSITDRLSADEASFGDVRAIAAAGTSFVILTDARLFAYDGLSLRTIAEVPRDAPKSLLATGDTVYLSMSGALRSIDGNGLRPKAEAALAALDGRVVDALVKASDGSWLATTRDLGLVAVSSRGLTVLRGAVTDWAKRNVVSVALRLRDGRIALGSRAGGVVLASSEGTLEQIIDSARGLPDDQVMQLCQDSEGGLWVALNSGLARLEVDSALTVYDARSGVLGGPQGIHRHAGRLFVFGSAGLGVVENGVLRRIPGIAGSTWFGLDAPGDPRTFLVAAASGVYRVVDDRATLLPGTADVGAYVLAEAPQLGGVLVGARGGLHLLEKAEGTYRLSGPLKRSPRYVRSIVVRPSGRVFFSTVFDGLMAADFDPKDATSARFHKLGGAEGDVHLSPDGPIAISSDSNAELFTIDETTPRLIADIPRTQALQGFTAWVSASDARGDLWLNTIPLRVFPRVNGSLLSEPVVLHSFPARRIGFIRPEPDGVVWVGGENGLYRHVGVPGGGLSAPPSPSIASVSIDDRRLFDGWGRTTELPAIAPQNLRRLKVAFGPLSQQRGLAYQFRLDPLDSDWSEWSPRSEAEFTTLQAAQYRFRVRTRGADGQVGPETEWRFVVDPPWYRTTAARLGAVLLLALLVGASVKVHTRVLRAEADRLAQRVEEKTHDLQEAVRELESSRARVEEQNRLLEKANARLEDVSRHDSLTGIANRRQFDQVLEEEWLRARRDRTSLAVGILDLDHFKDLNDAFGHPEGDEALRLVSKALEESMRRPADLIARYGGEEFAFVLSDTDLQGALRVAEDARARIEAMHIRSPGSSSGHLTASIGLVAAVPRDGLGADALIQAADRALYGAKAAGRNRVQGDEAPT
jgi:diguanylate cyclase (GGDEF)-like protein